MKLFVGNLLLPLSRRHTSASKRLRALSVAWGLVTLTMEGKDHAANSFLKWFVTEQVEKEASASEIVNKLKLAGDAPGGLFTLDREMDGRVFTLPAAPTRG